MESVAVKPEKVFCKGRRMGCKSSAEQRLGAIFGNCAYTEVKPRH